MTLDSKEEKNIPKYTREADIKRLSFIREQVSAHLGKVEGEVLDIGCGNGIISINLGAAGFNVVGVDVSDKAIEIANKQNPFPNVSFEVLPAEKLEAYTKQYDIIVCSEVLEHLQDPSRLVEELTKNLKPSGILIVTVPNGIGPRELLVTRPMIFIRDHLPFVLKFVLGIKKVLGYSGTTIQSAADNLDHIQFFTKKTLTKLADKNEFKIVTFAKSNFIDDVFPFSLFARRSRKLQQMDSRLADRLPSSFTGGFLTTWKKIPVA